MKRGLVNRVSAQLVCTRREMAGADHATTTCRAAGCSAPRTSPQAPKATKAQPKPVIQQPAEATNTFTRANFHELSDSYLIWADLPGKPSSVTAA